MANIDKELRDKMTVYTDPDKARIELIKRAMEEPPPSPTTTRKKSYSQRLALRLHLNRLRKLVNK